MSGIAAVVVELLRMLLLPDVFIGVLVVAIAVLRIVLTRALVRSVLILFPLIINWLII